MKRTFFILIALVVLMVAAAIGLVSSYNGIELHGLFIAAVLLALGVSLLFPKPVEHWFRLWFHPSHKGEIGNTTPISHKDPPSTTTTRVAYKKGFSALGICSLGSRSRDLCHTTYLLDDRPTGPVGFSFHGLGQDGPAKIPGACLWLVKVYSRQNYL